MCMPVNQFTPFYDERQVKYEIVSYQPLGFPEPELRVRMTPKRIHHTCSYCGCKTHIHEHKARTIHWGTHQGVPVIVEITDHIRHKCSRCGATFVEKYDFLTKGHSITTDTENYIIWQLGTVPMLRIAREIGVSYYFHADISKIQLLCVILLTVSRERLQIVSHSRSTTFSKVLNAILGKPFSRISSHICSIGFISGV